MKTTTVLSTKVHKYTPELLWWMQLNYFVSHIFKTFSENKGVRLVFGRYSLPSSLKRDTWTKAQKGKEAQKTIKAGQQNRGWVVVVGGQNAWEQEKIFLAPKQTRGGRCRDYFTCHGCYSQSYDILSYRCLFGILCKYHNCKVSWYKKSHIWANILYSTAKNSYSSHMAAMYVAKKTRNFLNF